MEGQTKINGVVAIVANYGFSAEADNLKRILGKSFDTVLVDNSSPSPPKSVDITLPNKYYTGLWNAAVEQAILKNKEWLLFIASDVEILDTDAFVSRIDEISRMRGIGLYTPSLSRTSRLAYPVCFRQDSKGLRECFVCEGFLFLIRTKIVSRIYPVDNAINKYGWGLDAYAGYLTYLAGYRAVVDDRVLIHHPAAIHEIPIEDARAQVKIYLPATVWKFLVWAELQIFKQSHRSSATNYILAPLSHIRWRGQEFLRLACRRLRDAVTTEMAIFNSKV